MVSDEIKSLVREKIYTDLEVYVLEKKTQQNFSLIKLLQDRLQYRSSLNLLLLDNGITIEDPISEGDFIQYDFSVKMNKGFQTDSIRYWKFALKMNLQNRMN